MKTKLARYGVAGLAATLVFFVGTWAQQTELPPSSKTAIAFLSQDIGATALRGNSSEARGIYEVHGAGADIWGGADSFHFAYTPWEGDGTIIARVSNVEKTDPWAKAGVMFRAGLEIGSPHAMVAMTPEKGAVFIRRVQSNDRSKDDAHQAIRMLRTDRSVIFQQRGSAGANQAVGSITAMSVPRCVKLVRQGVMFTAYDSSDGMMSAAE